MDIDKMKSRVASQETSSMKSLLSQEFDESDETSKHSRGYTHLGGDTQNQGNVIGQIPCVRQSKIGRQHEGGNTMKEALGQSHLKWEVEHAQGAFEGHSVYKAPDPLQPPTQTSE